MAIDAEGYPKMQSLGRKMMEELEQRGWSKLCFLSVWGARACVCVCVVCVCVCCVCMVCVCVVCVCKRGVGVSVGVHVWHLQSACVVCVAACKMGLPLSCGPHAPNSTHPLTPHTHFTLVFTPFTPPTHVHPLSALQVSRPTDGDHLPLLTHSSWHRTTCDCNTHSFVFHSSL